MSLREMFMGVKKEERKENRQMEAEIKSLEAQIQQFEKLSLQDSADAGRIKEKLRQTKDAYEAYKRGAGLK